MGRSKQANHSIDPIGTAFGKLARFFTHRVGSLIKRVLIVESVCLGGKMIYRNGINGLRGIAVLAVVLFHLGFSFASGGFLGVDVFLVVSGYLITSIIQEKVLSGSFSLADFLLSRVRRIYPAMLCVLLAIIIPGSLILAPGAFADLARSGLAALLSVANFHFYTTTGYFGELAIMQPLLHLWSLGVEMQFYLAWSLFIYVLTRYFRLSGSAMRWVVVGVILLSFYFGYGQQKIDPSSVFYFTQYRLWEFLLGALLAIKLKGSAGLKIRRRVVVEIICLLGLVMIFSGLSTLSEFLPFAQASALLVTVGTVMVIFAIERDSVLGDKLNSFPLGVLGNLSFSIYLWHWPIIVLFRQYNNGYAFESLDYGLVVLLTLALSYCSWRWIEQPMRKRKGAAANALLGGVVLSCVAFFLAVVVMKPVPDKSIESIADLEVMWEWACPEKVYFDYFGELCVVGGDWKTARHRALIWGDSHAQHLLPLLHEAGKKEDVAIVYYPGCSPDLDVIKISDPRYGVGCSDARVLGVNLLRSHPEIKTVLLAGAFSLHAPLLYKDEFDRGNPDKGASYVVEGLENLIGKIRALERQMVVIKDIPHFEYSPVPCVVGSKIELWRRDCSESISVSAQEYGAYSSILDESLKSLANTTDTSVFIPADTMCDEAQCVSKIDGELIYRDNNHLRRNLPLPVKEKLIQMLGIERMLGLPVSDRAPPLSLSR